MTTELLEDRQDEIRLIRESLRTFVTRLDNPRRIRRLRESAPNFERAVWTEMAQAGWVGMLLDEEQGGLGLGYAELAAVATEFGREVMPEPFVAASVLAGGVLRRLPQSDRLEELLERFVAGELIPALAWQEQNGLLDPDDLKLTADRDAQNITLTGTKMLVPAASGADGFLVTARSAGELVLVWVDRETPGVELTLQSLTDGGDFGTLKFDHLTIEESNTLGSGKSAISALKTALDEARFAVAAELLGLSERCLEMTLDYLRERKQFEVPIGSFQALQHQAADLFIHLELARSAVINAAEVFDSAAPRDADAAPTRRDPKVGDGHARGAAASNAKARCTETALLVTRRAIQLFGAIGYTEECDVSLYVRRAMTLAPWLGNAAWNQRRYLHLAPSVEEM